eukprot:scaffold244861_cov30-Tisochrysis_lutea.AAC.4
MRAYNLPNTSEGRSSSLVVKPSKCFASGLLGRGATASVARDSPGAHRGPRLSDCSVAAHSRSSTLSAGSVEGSSDCQIEQLVGSATFIDIKSAKTSG